MTRLFVIENDKIVTKNVTKLLSQITLTQTVTFFSSDIDVLEKFCAQKQTPMAKRQRGSAINLQNSTFQATLRIY